MDNQDLLNKPIGTKELPKLLPKLVEVQGLRIDPKNKKGTDKKAGDLLILICKHPDKESPLEISQIKILKNEQTKVTGLWMQLDEDENIQKGSVCDVLMSVAGVKTLNDLVGKKLPTIEQSKESAYLCIKAY